MEQGEEKKLKVYERRGQSSSSTSKSNSSCPFDLALEILLKLPAKSIVRYRCLSKLWSSITRDPYFISSFETRSLSNPSVLLFFRRMDKLLVFSFPQHHQNSNEGYDHYSSQPLDSYEIKYPKYLSLPFTESVHGLICLRKSVRPIIWNPTMRQFLTLPKPDKSWKSIAVYLGYDPVERKHKVLCLPCYQDSEDCRVLTLGSAQEQWRNIKTSHRHRPLTYHYWRCINGVLYYKASINNLPGDPGWSRPVIMSFDVRSEKFHEITFPISDMNDMFEMMLIAYKGRLALVHHYHGDNGITLWVLENAEEHKWSAKIFLAPFIHTDPVLKGNFKLSGITDAGEFIYLPSTFVRSYYIKYFDPERNSFRMVEFKDLADCKFRRSNGLGSRRLYGLQTFPNHIDNLTSLCNT